MSMTDSNANYIHSRVVTTVIDNSIVAETTDVSISFVLFQPYFSDSGIDGKVKSWNTETAFVAANGNPSMDKHGQQIYNAIQWLKGGGRVLGLRLTAEDALPAFGALNIRTRKTYVPVEYTLNDDGTYKTISKYTTALAISPSFEKVPTSILTSAILALPESVMLKSISSAMRSLNTTSAASTENALIVADLLSKTTNALKAWGGTSFTFSADTNSYTAGDVDADSAYGKEQASITALKTAIVKASANTYTSADKITNAVLKTVYTSDNMTSLYTQWSALAFDGNGNPARTKTYLAVLAALGLDTYEGTTDADKSTAAHPDPYVAAIIDAYVDWKGGTKTTGTTVSTTNATYYIAAALQNAYLTALDEYKNSKESKWTDHYLSVFKIAGKGTYGNKYGIYIQLNQTDEEDNDESRRWYFSVFKKDNYGNVTNVSSTYSVSFDDTAVDSSGTVSQFIDTVVSTDTFQNECDQVVSYTNTKVYSDLVSLFGNYTDEVDMTDGTVFSAAQKSGFIDFFTLLDMEGSAYKRFIPATATDKANMTTANDADEIDFTSGAYMQGGDDGSLDTSRYVVGTEPIGYTGVNKYYNTESDREDAIAAVKTDLLVKAYKGTIDPNILSPYKYQISAIIDAGNDATVKKQMIYLSRQRLDIVSYVDCNAAASAAAAISFRNNVMNGFTDWNASIWGQSAVAYDAYNKKNIDVTYLYDVAYKLPYLRANVGPNRLMAGTTKGAVATIKSMNWIPDEDYKTLLLKNQINYVEEVRLNQFAIMSSRTMYATRKSYLAVIRNVHAMCEAIYIGRQILTDLRFEDSATDAMTMAKEQITRNLQYLITNGPVEKLTVDVSQSVTEAADNEAEATIEMKFTDFISTWRFNIVATR